jgi:hypothetical protein
MNRLTGAMKLHMAGDSKFAWFLMPWGILFSSFIINVAIGVLAGGKVAIYTGGLSSIYIYMLIGVIVAVNTTFHFALGLSVRRTDYFLSTTIILTAISAIDAILLQTFALLEKNVFNGWGIQLHFFSLPYLNDGSVIEQFLIFFIVMLNMCFLGFVISSFYRRFGLPGLTVLGTLLLLITSVGGFACTYFNWWSDIFNWLGQTTAFQLALWLVPFTLVYLVCSYLLLRKATV